MDFSQILAGNAPQPAAQPAAPQGAFIPTPGLDEVVNNPLQGMMAGPPKTPEELQERKGKWGQVLEQIKNDPNMLAAMLHMGTRLMQPYSAEQTAAGQFGNALSGAATFYANANERDRLAGIDERKTQMLEKKTDADVRNSEASARKSELEAEEYAKTAQERARKRELELQKLEGDIEGNLDEKNLRSLQRKLALMEQEMKLYEKEEWMNPVAKQQREDLKKLAVKLEEAKIRRENAAATASNRSSAKDPTPAELYANDPTFMPDVTDRNTRLRLGAEEAAKMKPSGTTPQRLQEHASKKKTLMDAGWPEAQADIGAWQWIDEGQMPKSWSSGQSAGGKVTPGAIRLKSWDERNNLAPGQTYIGPDGKQYTKGS